MVNEIFETIQGEGTFTGTPSIFIRLQGCPVGCSWCDTKHTWDVLPQNQVSVGEIMLKKHDLPSYFTAEANELVQHILSLPYTAKHIVITGGEPCMYDLKALTSSFHQNGFSTQIETSGTFNVMCDIDTWVTVSPKINMKAGMPVLKQAMLRANEIKHPIAMQKHIEELDDLIAEVYSEKGVPSNIKVFLQPISQQTRATKLAIKTCIERNWCLSVQLHKYIGIE